MKIRWVTWFPAPYWNARFMALARRQGVDFRVYFLSSRSPEHDWTFSNDLFEFDHEYVPTLFPNRVPQGKRRRGLPIWALREREAALVLPYPEIDLMLAILGRRLLGGRTYAFHDNTVYDMRSGHWLHELSKRIAMNAANGVLAGGPRQKAYSLRYVHDADRVQSLGNPVDNEWYEARHRQLAAERDKLRARFDLPGPAVLYAGRFWHGKDVPVLIRAFGTIVRRLPSARLLLAGSGSEESTLRALAAPLGGAVRFLGFQSRDQLAELYEAADIFVLPSRSEPWGLVVNEAMLFEKPVVVSEHVGAAPVLVRDGYNGYVFPVGAADVLADRLVTLASRPDLIRDMGARSLEIVREHNLDRWVDNALLGLSRG